MLRNARQLLASAVVGHLKKHMQLIKQTQIAEGFQGFNLTEFAILHEISYDDSEIIDNFIKTENFSLDCLPEIVKNDRENPDFYLRQLFDNNKLSINDFKMLSKIELINYFESFAKHDDWGDDKIDFETLLGIFKSEIENSKSDKYFLIDKDWFDKESDKIRDPESWIYINYFLAIWIDRIENKLTVCEWNYD